MPFLRARRTLHENIDDLVWSNPKQKGDNNHNAQNAMILPRIDSKEIGVGGSLSISAYFEKVRETISDALRRELALLQKQTSKENSQYKARLDFMLLLYRYACIELNNVKTKSAEISSKNQELSTQILQLKKQIAVLEAQIKRLQKETGKDIVDIPPNSSTQSDTTYKGKTDTDSLQRALNAFIRKRKSNVMIGKLYEQYIGFLYERRGWQVEYYGMEHGVEDMCWDLICRGAINGVKRTVLVQCKCWSKSKQINWNHIFQLVGSSLYYENFDHEEERVSSAFWTSTELSDISRDCAEKFGIKFYENIPLKIVIKCKNADDKKKVFYMPFDKEYFGIRMKLKKGDMYVYSVSEAESNGFIYAHAK